MDIIKAESNWISLLIIVGSLVLGFINANKKKKNIPRPTPVHPEYSEEEQNDEMVDDYTSVLRREIEQAAQKKNTTKEIVEEKTPTFGDYYQPIMKGRKVTVDLEEEQEEELPTAKDAEHNSGIDLRQAVIFSEILKRPQY